MMKILFVIFVSLLSLALFLHPIDSDGDFFHHLNIGKYILQNHTLPHFDNLTFTAFGKEYIAHSWLTGVIFYFVYTNFGPIGINILVLAIAILTFCLSFYYLKILKINFTTSILTLLLIAPVLASRWPSRPEIFTYPIFLSFLILDQLKIKKPLIVLLYPLLMLLLVNLYGASFPMAALILILIILDNFWRDNFTIKRTKRLFYDLVLISFPVASFNGYGLKSIFYITYIPKTSNLWSDWIGIITLLGVPNFYGFSKIALFSYLTFFGFFLLSLRFSARKIKHHLLLFILSLALLIPFFAIRHRGLAAILSAPFLAILLSNLSQKIRWLGLSLAIALITISYISNPPAVGGNDVSFPPAMIKFIKDNHLSGRVLNPPRIGAFLEFNLSPKVLAFADTRDELFIGTDVLEKMDTIQSLGASLNYFLLKYKINLIIASPSDGNSYQDLLRSNRWVVVYFDNNYFIIIPKRVALEKNLPVLNPTTVFQ